MSSGTRTCVERERLIPPSISKSSDLRASFTSLVAVIENSIRGIDQKLRYPGRERFVVFYYEPRGEEVVWRDPCTYGFANGAAPDFEDELAPVADLYKVHVGSDCSPATHVLLVDRVDRRAYFVEKAQGLRFLAEVAETRNANMSAKVKASSVSAPAMSVEVTQETIAKLAYEIWEQRGRITGYYLRDWLEAEAKLAAMASSASASSSPVASQK
jgi:hypothetical protein